MIKENLDFETVFYNVTDKWNSQLKETSSYIFGLTYSGPKMVINKAKKTYKKWFFIFLLAFIVPSVFVDRLNFSFSESFINGTNLLIQVVSFVCFIILLYLVISKYRIKTKTTYSFVLKTQAWNLIYFPMLMLNSVFLKKQNTLSSLNLGLTFAFISVVCCYYFYFKKHKEAIKKYKIS